MTGVSRPDDIRRHNMALLLEQVHRHGPLTRAELTARLGLNRSTIKVLVAELGALGILEESVPARAGRGGRAGRPSHVVGPRPDGPYGLAVDVEVDRLTVAAVQLGGALLARQEVALPASCPSARSVAGTIVHTARRVAAEVPTGAWPAGMGVSIPGTVRVADGVVETAPNLGWRSEPLGAMLSDLLPAGTAVALANDADLGVLAEHLRGAARDATDVVYLTGKVGVGAGIIVDGRPLRGAGGLAGEIGHTVLDAHGGPCHCGGRGCVEGYIGEAALLAFAGRPGPVDIAAVSAVLDAARAGDPAARGAVHRVARSLGQVLTNLVNLLNPQVIVLGGVLADVFGLAGDVVTAELDSRAMSAARRMVTLRGSGLAGDSSLVGAAELAFRSLLHDPTGVLLSTPGDRSA
jgi:predicted NBD/HSP70 family sugar kinase